MFAVNLRRRGLPSPDRVRADLRPRTALVVSVKLSLAGAARVADWRCEANL